MPYTDLEIRILEKQAQGYPVEITFSGEQEFPRGFLDDSQLPWQPGSSSTADGERLFNWLFSDASLKTAWSEVRGQNPQRRIRLRIDTTAPELHAVPWELLREMTPNQPAQHLAATADTPLSRYLAGQWRQGRPAIERPLKMLIAIANPSDLSAYNLDPIDSQQERTLIQTALAQVPTEQLQLTILPAPVTLSSLEQALQQDYHILHIVAHGYITRNKQAVIYLENEQNQVDIVPAARLAEMLGRINSPLRLIYLASCQTAAASLADAFRGVAPALIGAGIPAVLAMQDKVPVATAREFTQIFYQQLLKHGQIDLASNLARAALLTANLPGAATPVLFMRLRTGLLFAQRGQILGERADSFWQILLNNIADGRVTPFLGPKVNRDLLPDAHLIANNLAKKYNYPFPDGHNLSRVAQFIRTIDDYRMRQDVIQTMIASYRRRIGQKPHPRDRRKSLSQVIEETDWLTTSRELTENDIYSQLADLELPLYLTTNFDNFMMQALKAKNLPARREVITWRDTLSQQASRPHYDLDPPPDPDSPVVLHLYGYDEDLLSMVLTEDDYLDYLAVISQDHEFILPTSVNEALASTTLLFLGYELNDLDFKVIMRGLLRNVDLRRWNMLHVAVQLEAEYVDETQQKEVVKYFQKYFGDLRIDVYWGNTHQFVTDLHTRWQKFWSE